MKEKKENFNDWYNEIVEEAKLIDKRYPIKGMNVWLPYGWSIARKMDEILRNLMNESNHDEVCFPLLIPSDQFSKEAEHIRGFGGEVFWVERGGNEKLDIPLILRPTSETAMYPMFSLWIRTHGDLPLKIFQIVNVFRYETKQTRAFMRVREIHFFEAHTCHESKEDSENQIKEDMEIWKKFCEKMALPYILNRRPDWDKFAGAEYSIAADTIMPSGRPLQIGTMHSYGQNFSKAYEIMYTGEDGSREFVYQTTFGISERIIGAIVGIHGDDRGLVLPPEIAPYQIVIIPIILGDKEIIIQESGRLFEELKNYFRVKLDDRDDYTPGYKFYDWELKGVPLRIEIGPRDIKNNVITIARRDKFERITVRRDEVKTKIREILDDIQKNLNEKAWKYMNSMIKTAESMEEIKKDEGVNIIHWCGSKDCADVIDNESGKKVLGLPLNADRKKGKCVVCGMETDITCYIGKPY